MTRDAHRLESTDPLRASQEEDSFDPLLGELARLDTAPCYARQLPRRDELVAGKYRIEEPLAAGGMGAVLRATHVVSGRQVALKWLLPAGRVASARFVREARAAAKVHHPNVVDVYDFDTHTGSPYLVMELLRGRTLGERMRGAKLCPRELAEVMIPTLRGVAAVHAQGIVHRDLKPDNVFLCAAPDGDSSVPKVLDFGIAKMRAELGQSETLTRAGTALGTLPYMSPEQLEDSLEVDERTDIYALGVIMYEALTGRRPFLASSDGALVRAIQEHKLASLRELEPRVPVQLERIVLRAMAKRAQDRYDSVDALMRDLSRWAEAPASERARAGWPVRSLRTAFGLVLTLAMFVLASFLLGDRTDRSRRGQTLAARAPASAALSARAQAGAELQSTFDPAPSALGQTPSLPRAQAPLQNAGAAAAVPHARRVRVKPRQGPIRLSEL